MRKGKIKTPRRTSQRSINLIEKRKEKKTAVITSRARVSKLAAQEEFGKAAKEVRTSIRKDKWEFTNWLAEKAEKATTD